MHQLPDGQSITVREEGQQLGEALMQPRLLGLDLPDLPSAAVTQIMQHPDGPTRKVVDGYSSYLHAYLYTVMQCLCNYAAPPAVCHSSSVCALPSIC